MEFFIFFSLVLSSISLGTMSLGRRQREWNKLIFMDVFIQFLAVFAVPFGIKGWHLGTSHLLGLPQKRWRPFFTWAEVCAVAFISAAPLINLLKWNKILVEEAPATGRGRRWNHPICFRRWEFLGEKTPELKIFSMAGTRCIWDCGCSSLGTLELWPSTSSRGGCLLWPEKRDFVFQKPPQLQLEEFTSSAGLCIWWIWVSDGSQWIWRQTQEWVWGLFQQHQQEWQCATRLPGGFWF